MRLSTKTRYGARAMLELTISYGVSVCPVKSIAKKQNISERYLQNILLMLVDAGLVKSVRGKKGGFMLAKAPDEINMAEIVSVLEEGNSLVECIIKGNCCGRAGECIMKDVWQKASESLYGFLSGITLKDIARMRTEKDLGIKILDFNI